MAFDGGVPVRPLRLTSGRPCSSGPRLSPRCLGDEGSGGAISADTERAGLPPNTTGWEAVIDKSSLADSELPHSGTFGRVDRFLKRLERKPRFRPAGYKRRGPPWNR